MDKEKYNNFNEIEKTEYVKNRYDGLPDETDIYATSTDMHLKELEIDFILKYVWNNASILDIGCGNGYTDFRIAEMVNANIIGIDISKRMIDGACKLKYKFKDKLLGNVEFHTQDCCKGLNWHNDALDIVISERLIHNLPSRNAQYKMIREIYRVLKKDGIYIMIEGTIDGLNRLNNLRVKCGLGPIPDRKETNIMSLKLDEREMEEFLSQYFKFVKKQYFGMYYFISRIIHPLLVSPDQPQFDAKINEVARKIASVEPNYKNLGHVYAMVLQKR